MILVSWLGVLQGFEKIIFQHFCIRYRFFFCNLLMRKWHQGDLL